VAVSIQDARAGAALKAAAEHARNLHIQQRPCADAWFKADENLASVFEDVETYRLYGKDAVDRDVRILLDLAGYPRTQYGAHKLLEDCGFWSRHEVPAVVGAGVQAVFDEHVEHDAATLACPTNRVDDEHAEHRKDLTKLRSIAIDDPWTEEVDDAVYAEPHPSKEGWIRIFVHIADPTRFIPLGSEVEKEAAQRSTSCYMPTGTATMLPSVLAKAACSLHERDVEANAKPRAAMTVRVDIKPDGSIGSYAVVGSQIMAPRRATYDEVEAFSTTQAARWEHEETFTEPFDQLGSDDVVTLNEAEDEDATALACLFAAASRRRAYRDRNQCVTFPQIECRVLVSRGSFEQEAGVPRSFTAGPHPDDAALGDDTVVALQRIESSSMLAREMVKEMMVLTGETIAMYGAKNNIPLAFRGQDTPTLPSESELPSHPHARAVVMRRCMTRAKLSVTDPINHASLGLPGYVQFTSPIRRYSDLLAHYQIKAFLRDEEIPFTDKNISLRLGESDDSVRDRNKAGRESDTYWVHEFFRRRAAEAVANGDVTIATFNLTPLLYLRDTGTIAVVCCEEVGAEFVTRIPEMSGDGKGVRPPIGESIELTIERACPIDKKIDVVFPSEWKVVAEYDGDDSDKENVSPEPPKPELVTSDNEK